MLLAQPRSHRRTALHWAAWSNAPLLELEKLVRGNPEALIMRDDKNKGNRTPLEILRHYFPKQDDKEKALGDFTTRWIKHRLQMAVNLSCNRYFVTEDKTPFDKNDRKAAGIKPRAWFALSVMGYFLQREMKPLVVHILKFLGQNAKIDNKTKKKRKRKRKRKG